MFFAPSLRHITCTAIVAACVALTGCAAAGLAGLGATAAPQGAQADQYMVNAEYSKVFAAAKVAVASLSMATITSADADIGIIQVKRGAAKNINIMVKRTSTGASVKIDVVNMAGIWALMDPKTDVTDIVKSMSATLGMPVTAGATVAAAPPMAAPAASTLAPAPDAGPVAASTIPSPSKSAAANAVAPVTVAAPAKAAPAPAAKAARRVKKTK